MGHNGSLYCKGKARDTKCHMYISFKLIFVFSEDIGIDSIPLSSSVSQKLLLPVSVYIGYGFLALSVVFLIEGNISM